ncbi:helix-turn-helix domain-containing protein [Kribbella pratensis]|nr:helix-turn-helix transcriptional regulator [Kribbella pratensis]
MMDRLYAIELEPEVRAWLESLPAKHFLKVEEYVGLLAEQAASLGEPHGLPEDVNARGNRGQAGAGGQADLRGSTRTSARGVRSDDRERRDRAMSHSRWKTVRQRKLGAGAVEPEDVVQARREIRLSMALAKAVYERRVELGLTQSQLADRAGLTQAKVSRIEGSDTVPTLPLLSKLALALDASLNIALDGDESRISFTPHTTDAA